MRRPTLRFRLFASYAAVVLVGATVLATVLELLGPPLFDHGLAGMGFGRGPGGTGIAALQEAFRSTLWRSTLAAVAASLLVAGGAATIVARRLLRPIDEIRAATERLASGHYDEPIPLPTERELAGLVMDVNGLADSLATSERRRATLVGDVAHEMRTPLTTVRGYIDGLADGIFRPDEAAAVISDEIQRLERLAEDLAAVSKVEEGRLTLTMEATDLAELVTDVVDRLRPRFAAAGVEVTTELRPAPVLGDRGRLAQAVTNLVGNAVSYTPSGGTVTIATASDASTAALSVADTGIGIAAGDLERIFERFYRARPEAHTGGTGIGLTIAQAIVRGHGGELSADSPGEGLGSVFVVRLPVRPESGRSAQSADAADANSVRKAGP